MREILFRGKGTTTRKWKYGCLKQSPVLKADTTIYDHSASLAFLVDPSTVGQYTGLKDKSGTKIFEGDIVENPADQTERWEIVFKEGEFAGSGDNVLEHLAEIQDCEVIGNIHDNPELLESED